MRFELFHIQENEKYSFVIETKAKPDNDLKERIRAQIREAMESLGREPDSYSVQIWQLMKTEEEPGSKEFPKLGSGSDYLLFAISDMGDSADKLSERELDKILEEQREELSRGIFVPKGSRVTLVLLYDAIVGAVITQGPAIVSIVNYAQNLYSPSRRSGYRRS